MSYVHLTTFTNYMDAHLCQMHLQEDGINCWLKDENTVTIDPILTNAIGGIKLMVHESQAERAIDLLRIMKNKEHKAMACPKCNSLNVEYIVTNRKASNWLSAITTFLLGDFAMAPHQVYHCFDCGHEFDKNQISDVAEKE
ncbi:MAG: putative signal transducing protein [Chitinophagaceae bacterium]|jgi:DNA-directed RNA polymerase subunit RPC12/RpoP